MATTVFVHLSVKLVKVEIVVGVFYDFFCIKTFVCSKKERIPFIVSFVVIHAFCLWLDINVQKCIKGDSGGYQGENKVGGEWSFHGNFWLLF